MIIPRVEVTNTVEELITLSVPRICPDCPFRGALIEMARHYRETDHGRRTRP